MATWKKATHFLCHHAKLCQFLWVNAPWSPVFIWSTSKAHKIVLITISNSFILFRERISHFFILLSPDVYSSLYVPDLLLREDLLIYLLLWRRKWQPTPVLLPGKYHGWRSLVGYSPWVAEGWTWLSDFTFTFHFQALEKKMATHSSTLAWKIPWAEEPGGLQSMGSLRVGHDWATSLFTE